MFVILLGHHGCRFDDANHFALAGGGGIGFVEFIQRFTENAAADDCQQSGGDRCFAVAEDFQMSAVMLDATAE